MLDDHGVIPLYEAADAEAAACCWLDHDRVLMAASAAEPLDGDNDTALSPGQLGVWFHLRRRLATSNLYRPRGRNDDRPR